MKTTSDYWFSYQKRNIHLFNAVTTEWMNWIIWGVLGEKTISRLSPVGFKMHTRAIWSSIWISVGNGLEFEKKKICVSTVPWWHTPISHLNRVHAFGILPPIWVKEHVQCRWARPSPCGKCLGHWLRIATLLNNHYEMLYVGGWFGLQ